ncbi:MAG TPA: DUF1570 domain-containing protein [Pirellulales bacterium]|jgi:hypothetical protein|nr:DUF1570 domain-containing protein [Pirellulales bacterium]
MTIRRSPSATLALGLALVVGCAGVSEAPNALPVRHAMVFDQLVVYSDFNLPQHDRLVDDLRQLRSDVTKAVNLPGSSESIHVYLFENEDRFRDFLAKQHPEFPARRAFFVEQEARLTVYAQWSDRVAEDLRHEVAHGYLHSMVHNIPLWLDEGLAEYFEVPRGSAGLNRPHVRLLLAKQLQTGWRPDLARLERLEDVGGLTQEDYAEAWLWTHWLLETDPQRRALVQGYLQTLRKHGSAEPLSSTVVQVAAQPEQALMQHLYGLAPQLAAQSP